MGDGATREIEACLIGLGESMEMALYTFFDLIFKSLNGNNL